MASFEFLEVRIAAMALLGVGCSNILMAAYYIFARTYAPAVFATLAAVFLGTGMLGNLAGSLPMALAAEASAAKFGSLNVH